MSKKIHHRNDKFVRAAFADADRAAAFFEKFLPAALIAELDFNTLNPLQESYIQGDLAEYFSDMIFEINYKSRREEKSNLVLLFEHKSAPDKHVMLQVGFYLFSHWFRSLNEKKPLRPIIPIIYYQGKKAWNAPELEQLFDLSLIHI